MDSQDKKNNHPSPNDLPTGDDSPSSFSMGRRHFFKVLGSGIAVAFVYKDLQALEQLEKSTEATIDRDEIGAWLHIGEGNTLKVFTGKVEVGQNIRTSLAQIVVEELNVPLSMVDMTMGDTDLVPYDSGTYGSKSIPEMGPQLRKVAATTRNVLLDMASEHWQTETKHLQLREGQIKNTKTQETLHFGELTKGKELLKPINNEVVVKPVKKWEVAGTSVPKANGANFVTGKHQFVSDMQLPGMLYGKILRPAAFGATIASLNLEAAKAIKGVQVVQEGDFIGVVAPDSKTASEAIHKIRAEWQTVEQPSRENLFDYLKANPRESRGWGGSSTDTQGDIKRGLNASDITAKSQYTVDYIAHAPLEPRAALAQWKNGNLKVWTGTQRPFGVKSELAEAFQLAEDKVRVIMPDTGSGYGGKHSGEAAVEAARLAKATGKPVKLVWSREEEFTWAYFRPAGVIDVQGGARKNGKLQTWEFHNYNSGGSGIDTPYNASDQHIEYHPANSPLRQGSYRGLATTANIFARESHMDDLAHELGMDPLTFRLQNLQDERLRAVFQKAADAFGWKDKPESTDHGYGMGGGAVKGSFVATCAEVAVDRSTGEIKVVRITEAFECGAIINPEHLENQVKGAIVQGLGGALFERIDFGDGKIRNPRFSGYRVPKFSDTPPIEVALLNRPDLPSAGAGETPIVGIAPAIRNAVFNAVGVKLTTLPLAPEGISHYLN